MVKRRKNKGAFGMDVDSDVGAGDKVAQEMDTSDFVSLEQPDGELKQKGPKLKPKRGKATQKQKRRLALKLDKALSVADRRATKNSKGSFRKEQKNSMKQLWVGKEKSGGL
ncbi:hypothetical protein COCSUDRAFT_48382 [Coccomyxa subellipsoidea C-169]|uniref:Uncharacterized protein n=1 Tax=Coccomyxa subellipsoidea (strain C-169) TaxID=574566 RepID=I0YQR6_COCSC|nr:hypothetical protein COCSUDRAFT_48382 [Coccomyxa subellipsoidea C-169]EIE20735.1 hypothetical protein COCSUDRAFT_48382 [Coccomyxa subellipsoidea C-169]|eukprot:XP_005645279.1 hypothetical protein COCSUDRAFT_48382 [Coccomyxa subellipsoidea C-169]